MGCCGSENININQNNKNNNNNSNENDESTSNNINQNKNYKKNLITDELSSEIKAFNVDNHLNLQFLSIPKKKQNNTNNNNQENGFEIKNNLQFISLTIKAEYFLKETLLPIG